jgi:hypothetical protein
MKPKMRACGPECLKGCNLNPTKNGTMLCSFSDDANLSSFRLGRRKTTNI